MEVVVESISHVWQGYGREVVSLDQISHRFRSGRVTCILGPSGCGKSTLVQIVGGLVAPTRGRVEIVDPMHNTAPRPLGGDSVMVWQTLNLFPWRTVLDNVAFGLEMAGVARAQRYEKARSMIASVNLQGFESYFPKQLSGGMRQRVALARALIMGRAILLMDEPFAALDAQTKIVMQEELMRVFERTKKTILFVTHAIDEAILLADDILVMTARPGRIKHIISVDLPRPRSFEMVNTPLFGALFDQVFHLIRDEVTKAMSEQAAKTGSTQ
jgi:NitT/TauT family transport system ATP-binding protein